MISLQGNKECSAGISLSKEKIFLHQVTVCAIIAKQFPGVAQLVARVIWDHEAASSSLATRTIKM